LRGRPPEQGLIELGRIAGAFGVRGWVTVVGETGLLAASSSWRIDGIERPVERTRMHSGRLLAKLAGVETREAAKALMGRRLSVPRSALPEPPRGTYYWADLVGLEVVNAQGLVLGVVKGMFSNGAHDVMELGSDLRERLLPFVPAVVRQVDLDARRVLVDWGADW
jgi:16S rRNA processing protein RimM